MAVAQLKSLFSGISNSGSNNTLSGPRQTKMTGEPPVIRRKTPTTSLASQYYAGQTVTTPSLHHRGVPDLEYRRGENVGSAAAWSNGVNGGDRFATTGRRSSVTRQQPEVNEMSWTGVATVAVNGGMEEVRSGTEEEVRKGATALARSGSNASEFSSAFRTVNNDWSTTTPRNGRFSNDFKENLSNSLCSLPSVPSMSHSSQRMLTNSNSGTAHSRAPGSGDVRHRGAKIRIKVPPEYFTEYTNHQQAAPALPPRSPRGTTSTPALGMTSDTPASTAAGPTIVAPLAAMETGRELHQPPQRRPFPGDFRRSTPPSARLQPPAMAASETRTRPQPYPNTTQPRPTTVAYNQPKLLNPLEIPLISVEKYKRIKDWLDHSPSSQQATPTPSPGINDPLASHRINQVQDLKSSRTPGLQYPDSRFAQTPAGVRNPDQRISQNQGAQEPDGGLVKSLGTIPGISPRSDPTTVRVAGGMAGAAVVATRPEPVKCLPPDTTVSVAAAAAAAAGRTAENGFRARTTDGSFKPVVRSDSGRMYNERPPVSQPQPRSNPIDLRKNSNGGGNGSAFHQFSRDQSSYDSLDTTSECSSEALPFMESDARSSSPDFTPSFQELTSSEIARHAQLSRSARAASYRPPPKQRPPPPAITPTGATRSGPGQIAGPGPFVSVVYIDTDGRSRTDGTDFARAAQYGGSQRWSKPYERQGVYPPLSNGPATATSGRDRRSLDFGQLDVLRGKTSTQQPVAMTQAGGRFGGHVVIRTISKDEIHSASSRRDRIPDAWNATDQPRSRVDSPPASRNATTGDGKHSTAAQDELRYARSRDDRMARSGRRDGGAAEQERELTSDREIDKRPRLMQEAKGLSSDNRSVHKSEARPTKDAVNANNARPEYGQYKDVAQGTENILISALRKLYQEREGGSRKSRGGDREMSPGDAEEFSDGGMSSDRSRSNDEAESRDKYGRLLNEARKLRGEIDDRQSDRSEETKSNSEESSDGRTSFAILRKQLEGDEVRRTVDNNIRRSPEGKAKTPSPQNPPPLPPKRCAVATLSLESDTSTDASSVAQSQSSDSSDDKVDSKLSPRAKYPSPPPPLPPRRVTAAARIELRTNEIEHKPQVEDNLLPGKPPVSTTPDIVSKTDASNPKGYTSNSSDRSDIYLMENERAVPAKSRLAQAVTAQSAPEDRLMGEQESTTTLTLHDRLSIKNNLPSTEDIKLTSNERLTPAARSEIPKEQDRSTPKSLPWMESSTPKERLTPSERMVPRHRNQSNDRNSSRADDVISHKTSTPTGRLLANENSPTTTRTNNAGSKYIGTENEPTTRSSVLPDGSIEILRIVADGDLKRTPPSRHEDNDKPQSVQVTPATGPFDMRHFGASRRADHQDNNSASNQSIDIDRPVRASPVFRYSDKIAGSDSRQETDNGYSNTATPFDRDVANSREFTSYMPLFNDKESNRLGEVDAFSKNHNSVKPDDSPKIDHSLKTNNSPKVDNSLTSDTSSKANTRLLQEIGQDNNSHDEPYSSTSPRAADSASIIPVMKRKDNVAKCSRVNLRRTHAFLSNDAEKWINGKRRIEFSRRRWTVDPGQFGGDLEVDGSESELSLTRGSMDDGVVKKRDDNERNVQDKPVSPIRQNAETHYDHKKQMAGNRSEFDSTDNASTTIERGHSVWADKVYQYFNELTSGGGVNDEPASCTASTDTLCADSRDQQPKAALDDSKFIDQPTKTPGLAIAPDQCLSAQSLVHRDVSDRLSEDRPESCDQKESPRYSRNTRDSPLLFVPSDEQQLSRITKRSSLYIVLKTDNDKTKELSHPASAASTSNQIKTIAMKAAGQDGSPSASSFIYKNGRHPEKDGYTNSDASCC